MQVLLIYPWKSLPIALPLDGASGSPTQNAAQCLLRSITSVPHVVSEFAEMQDFWLDLKVACECRHSLVGTTLTNQTGSSAYWCLKNPHQEQGEEGDPVSTHF